MSAPTVRVRPTDYDFFLLDGERSPGTCKIASGGEAREEIQDQRQQLTTGANSVVQYSKNAIITYELILFTDADLRLWQGTWEPRFLTGRSKRPPRVYQIVDLRASWLKRVIFESMSPQGLDKPGGPWPRTLVLHQYNRVAPYGGPVVPGAFDAQIKANDAEIAALRAQQAALHPAASKFVNGKKP